MNLKHDNQKVRFESISSLRMSSWAAQSSKERSLKKKNAAQSDLSFTIVKKTALTKLSRIILMRNWCFCRTTRRIDAHEWCDRYFDIESARPFQESAETWRECEFFQNDPLSSFYVSLLIVLVQLHRKKVGKLPPKLAGNIKWNARKIDCQQTKRF